MSLLFTLTSDNLLFIMQNSGSALMGIGQASGENRAAEAARKAISSPLLETSINGAKGVLLNITGGSNLTLFEVNEASQIIADAVDPDANIIFGSVINPDLKDEVRVTVIATGFEVKDHLQKEKVVEPKIVQNISSDGELDIPEFLRHRRSS